MCFQPALETVQSWCSSEFVWQKNKLEALNLEPLVGVRGGAKLAFGRPFGKTNCHPFRNFATSKNHRYLLSYSPEPPTPLWRRHW